MTRGRRPQGPKLVEGLESSEMARQRLRVILETISGEKSVPEACEDLAISEAMFHKLRSRFLKEAVSLLEPRQPGRKKHVPDEADARLQELQKTVEKLSIELEGARIQTELALIMPQMLEDRVLKKKATKKKKKKRKKKKRR